MTLRLLVRDGCHLCEDAAQLLAELGLAFERVDVDGDTALAAAFGDAVPVLLLGGREIARAPLDRASLVRALAEEGVASDRASGEKAG